MMNQPRKQDEKKIALFSYLCGWSAEELKHEYGIHERTLEDIAHREAWSWNDPIITTFLRNRTKKERERNAARVYLLAKEVLPHSEFPTIGLYHLPARHIVERTYEPLHKAVVQRTQLPQLLQLEEPYDRLAKRLYRPSSPHALAAPIIDSCILAAFHNPKRYQIQDVENTATQQILQRIKQGALGWTAYKKSVADMQFRDLNAVQIAVLRLRFGLDDGTEQSFVNIAQLLVPTLYDAARTPQYMREVESRALPLVQRHPIPYIKLAMGMATDEEVRERVQQHQAHTHRDVKQELPPSQMSIRKRRPAQSRARTVHT